MEQNLARMGQVVEQLQKQIYRLRLRRGSTEGGGTRKPFFLGDWNDTMAVSADQMVFFTPEGGQTGAYICILDAPIGTDPSDAAYYVRVPTPAPGVWFF